MIMKREISCAAKKPLQLHQTVLIFNTNTNRESVSLQSYLWRFKLSEEVDNMYVLILLFSLAFGRCEVVVGRSIYIYKYFIIMVRDGERGW